MGVDHAASDEGPLLDLHANLVTWGAVNSPCVDSAFSSPNWMDMLYTVFMPISRMSINHYSSDLRDTLWWQQRQQQLQQEMEPTQNTQSPNREKAPFMPQGSSSWRNHPYYQQHQQQAWLNSSYNLQPRESGSMFPVQNDEIEELDDQNAFHEQQQQEQQQQQERQQDERRRAQESEKEPLFEKPLTPSDVGKLNRLVIPKQHAEKYFPLGGGGDSVEKGLLLSFEDETGKCWRFRYSYWNSSQSYVLTKGWSRYVKEKQLDAGDVVLFERHRTDADRLFIGWRRRAPVAATTVHDFCSTAAYSGSGSGWGRGLVPYHGGHIHGLGSNSAPYQPDCLHAGAAMAEVQAPPVGNSKRLRLFGVNLECQLDDSEPSTPDGSSMSSQGPPQQHFYSEPHSSSPNYMDITFSRQMRDRRG